MTFHEILMQERKRRGLSQEELAARLNVSRQAVSKWETGDSVPDLPKLLALADTLNLSLDTLCGRELSSAPASKLPPQRPAKRHKLPQIISCAVALLLLLFLSLSPSMIPRSARSDSPASPSTDLTKEFTVSGLNFSGKSGVVVAYQFTPSISGEELSYQIIFTDFDGNSIPIDAPCSNGVCAGEATLPSGYAGYAVTIRVTNGMVSRNVAVARNLNFSHGNASWTPID